MYGDAGFSGALVEESGRLEGTIAQSGLGVVCMRNASSTVRMSSAGSVVVNNATSGDGSGIYTPGNVELAGGVGVASGAGIRTYGAGSEVVMNGGIIQHAGEGVCIDTGSHTGASVRLEGGTLLNTGSSANFVGIQSAGAVSLKDTDITAKGGVGVRVAGNLTMSGTSRVIGDTPIVATGANSQVRVTENAVVKTMAGSTDSCIAMGTGTGTLVKISGDANVEDVSSAGAIGIQTRGTVEVEGGSVLSAGGTAIDAQGANSQVSV